MTSAVPGSDLEPGEYPVKAVVGYKYRKRFDRFFFVTVWEETDPSGKNKKSAIPLENFISTPAPIFNFAKRSTRPPVSRNDRRWLGRRVCPSEYIPKGTEFVRKIYHAFTTKVRGNVQEFYSVRLWGDDAYHVIRLIFMEYYFPRELLLFWTKHGLSGPNFPRDE
jgi:hypothetical protein